MKVETRRWTSNTEKKRKKKKKKVNSHHPCNNINLSHHFVFHLIFLFSCPVLYCPLTLWHLIRREFACNQSVEIESKVASTFKWNAQFPFQGISSRNWSTGNFCLVFSFFVMILPRKDELNEIVHLLFFRFFAVGLVLWLNFMLLSLDDDLMIITEEDKVVQIGE